MDKMTMNELFTQHHNLSQELNRIYAMREELDAKKGAAQSALVELGNEITKRQAAEAVVEEEKEK